MFVTPVSTPALTIGLEAQPPHVSPGAPGAGTLSRAGSGRRLLGRAGVVLVIGAALTAVVVALVLVDPTRAWFWELLHWDISAATGFLTIAVSLPGTTGLVRRIGLGSLVAMGFWLASNVAWTTQALTGSVIFPSIADLLAVLWIVPGGWMLMTSIHGRVSLAEEAAVYLDDALVFVATVAALLATFGPAAYFIGGVPGLLVAVYPALFIGAAGCSVVGVLANREPLRLEGGLAYGLGSGLMGIAYATWLTPAISGLPVDHVPAVLFSVGPLVIAYGAISWRGSSQRSVPSDRPTALLGWAIGPLAVVVAAVSAVVVGPIDDLEHVTYGLMVLAVTLLIVRFALHLHERTTTLAAMRRLYAENEVLVQRLGREALERERVHARLVDASRMSAVGELAAAVAHEVNNPLTGVLGYTDLLLADPELAPHIREDLAVVRAEAIRVRDRVRILLDFATPRRPDAERADLDTVVAAPLALLRYHQERHGLTIHERYEPMAPVLVDVAAIQQVIISVVTEIAAAMPAGGRLTVSTEAASCGASIVFDAEGTEMDPGAIRAAQRPFDDEFDRDDRSGAIASSYGVLLGLGATIGLRAATSEHIRIEIHLPRPDQTAG